MVSKKLASFWNCEVFKDSTKSFILVLPSDAAGYTLSSSNTLSDIWNKDKEDGIIRYGAVALRRALTSPRSNYYYKYKKYYTHIDSLTSAVTYNEMESGETIPSKHLYNLPNELTDDYIWTSLEKIDTALDSFSWYDTKVFQLYYYEGNTLDSLAAKTGISRNSLYTTIDKVRTELKYKLSE